VLAYIRREVGEEVEGKIIKVERSSMRVTEAV